MVKRAESAILARSPPFFLLYFAFRVEQNEI